jgi:acetyltransferase-like isoleucine patch superfamily enzyme
VSAPDDLLAGLRGVLADRGAAVRAEWHRSLAFGDYVSDRWDKARALGWGEGSSVYDSCLVIGDVSVGAGVWVGPYTVLDGSGGLSIGDGCTVSAGVHVYTHDNVAQTVTGGAAAIEQAPVEIGARTYLGPHTVVVRGVRIGSGCVVGAGTLVRRDVPDGMLVVGTPGRVVARVVVDGASVRFDYDAVPGAEAAP